MSSRATTRSKWMPTAESPPTDASGAACRGPFRSWISNLQSSFSSDPELPTLHRCPAGQEPPVWRCLSVGPVRSPLLNWGWWRSWWSNRCPECWALSLWSKTIRSCWCCPMTGQRQDRLTGPSLPMRLEVVSSSPFFRKLQQSDSGPVLLPSSYPCIRLERWAHFLTTWKVIYCVGKFESHSSIWKSALSISRARIFAGILRDYHRFASSFVRIGGGITS